MPIKYSITNLPGILEIRCREISLNHHYNQKRKYWSTGCTPSLRHRYSKHINQVALLVLYVLRKRRKFQIISIKHQLRDIRFVMIVPKEFVVSYQNNNIFFLKTLRKIFEKLAPGRNITPRMYRIFTHKGPHSLFVAWYILPRNRHETLHQDTCSTPSSSRIGVVHHILSPTFADNLSIFLPNNNNNNNYLFSVERGEISETTTLGKDRTSWK